MSAYWVINPLNPALLALSCNRITQAKETATAKDVPRLCNVLLDVDSHRRKGISATDAELGHALDLRDRILQGEPKIRERSWGGVSGNGGYLIFRLPRPLPNTDASQAKIKAFLKALAAKYRSDHASLDVCTNDPARLACVGGSVKVKGDHLPSRPWRSVTVDHVGAFFR
ncbi:hypothetical protein [Singulisphaera sp. PoT]|uniref:hypothetical protein n=1 Tax=Singulisphaera sp. PoT TaxID=3411797 RepID=UPI003BF5BE63